MDQWNKYRAGLKPGMPLIGFDLQNQSQGCSSQVLRYIEQNAREYAQECLSHEKVCEYAQKRKQIEKSNQNRKGLNTLCNYLNIR